MLRFFCKKISMSTFSEARQERLALIMSPAVEKTLTYNRGSWALRPCACFATWGTLTGLFSTTQKDQQPHEGNLLSCMRGPPPQSFWKRAWSAPLESSPNNSDTGVFWGGDNEDGFCSLWMALLALLETTRKMANLLSVSDTSHQKNISHHILTHMIKTI